MKNVLIVLLFLVLGFGAIMLAGGNDLGLMVILSSSIGLWFADRNIILGE